MFVTIILPILLFTGVELKFIDNIQQFNTFQIDVDSKTSKSNDDSFLLSKFDNDNFTPNETRSLIEIYDLPSSKSVENDIEGDSYTEADYDYFPKPTPFDTETPLLPENITKLLSNISQPEPSALLRALSSFSSSTKITKINVEQPKSIQLTQPIDIAKRNNTELQNDSLKVKPNVENWNYMGKGEVEKLMKSMQRERDGDTSSGIMPEIAITTSRVTVSRRCTFAEMGGVSFRKNYKYTTIREIDHVSFKQCEQLCSLDDRCKSANLLYNREEDLVKCQLKREKVWINRKWNMYKLTTTQSSFYLELLDCVSSPNFV